jgi:hypothetical protein
VIKVSSAQAAAVLVARQRRSPYQAAEIATMMTK